MRDKLLLAVVLVSAAFGTAQSLAVKAGRLVDVENGRVLENQTILIEADRIKAVGPNLPIPSGAKVIDLSGMTVLPGLIDMHTHLTYNAFNLDPLSEISRTSAEQAFASIPNARKTVEAGFTTVRDVGTYRALVDVAL